LDTIKQGQKTSDVENIITQMDNNTKAIFRMDVGKNEHSMVNYGYPYPTNHINIAIQAIGANGRYSTKWNYHIMLNGNGKLDKIFSTGVWNK
jgi:hypothetical protein